MLRSKSDDQIQSPRCRVFRCAIFPLPIQIIGHLSWFVIPCRNRQKLLNNLLSKPSKSINWMKPDSVLMHKQTGYSDFKLRFPIITLCAFRSSGLRLHEPRSPDLRCTCVEALVIPGSRVFQICSRVGSRWCYNGWYIFSSKTCHYFMPKWIQPKPDSSPELEWPKMRECLFISGMIL